MPKTRIHGLEIAFDDHGSGPAAVLIHGYPFNRSMWRELSDVLKRSHRVVAPDLRGLGESTVAPATINDMANDIAGLMTSLQIEAATICGLSMGGYVGLAFYRLHPQRVRALVLADTRASADTDEARQNRSRQVELALHEGMEAIASEMLPKLLAPETLSTRPEVVARVRQMIIQTKPEGAVVALKAMAARDDQTSLLASIRVPTLILVGRNDVITPLKDSELMHQEIRGSSLEIIEGAGHMSNVEQPERFNHAVEDFSREE